MPLSSLSHQGSFVRAGRWGSLLSGAGTLLLVCVCTALSLGTREYYPEVRDGKGLLSLCSLGYPLTPAWGGGKARFPEAGTSQAASSTVRPAGELINHTAASHLCSPVLFSHASRSSPACWTPCSWAMWAIPRVSIPYPQLLQACCLLPGQQLSSQQLL